MHKPVPAAANLALSLLVIFAPPANGQTRPAAQPAPATAPSLPVKAPAGADAPPETIRNVRCLFSLDQIQAALKDGPAAGLLLDFTGSTTLLDGSTIDPSELYGTASIGPYPCQTGESSAAAKRFRRSVNIQAGKALLPIADLFEPDVNSQKWTDRGSIVLRLQLHLARPGQDRPLGAYDTFAAFHRQADACSKLPCLIEGPFINRLSSDDTATALITFVTSEPVQAKVLLDGKKPFADAAPATQHEIELSGLEPGHQYAYRIDLGQTQTPDYTFRTAPPRGLGSIIFAFAGDSAESLPTDLANSPGVSATSLDRMLNYARRSGTLFLVMGGNLSAGQTTSPADLRMQLNAWKQTAAGYGHTRPIYTLMGAGESSLRAYQPPAAPLLLDRWPYATDSAEAIFGQVFANAAGGPVPSDPRRPPYRGTVYAFQYGTVKIICLNNNYWYSSDPKALGGCPEGYILDDQLLWLAQQITAAEEDKTVKYILVCLAQPVLPNGGRVTGGMWAGGDNNPRPHVCDARTGQLKPAAKGLIQMRNDFLRIMDRSLKLVAVLSSGEHAYHRLLLDNQVPLGDPAKDDKDHTGRLGLTCSPLTDLEHGTWYIVSGGIGAPQDAQQPTPWNTFYSTRNKPDMAQPPEKRRYRYEPRESLLVFQAMPDKINLTVFTPYGDTIETIPDLLRFKRGHPLSKCCTEGVQ